MGVPTTKVLVAPPQASQLPANNPLIAKVLWASTVLVPFYLIASTLYSNTLPSSIPIILHARRRPMNSTHCSSNFKSLRLH